VANSLNHQHRGTTMFSQFMKPFCQLTGSAAPAQVSEDQPNPSNGRPRQRAGAESDSSDASPTRPARSGQSGTAIRVVVTEEAKRRSSRSEGTQQASKKHKAGKEGALQGRPEDHANRSRVVGEPYQATSDKIPFKPQRRPRPTSTIDANSGQRREGKADESPPRKPQEDVKFPKRDGIIAFFV
jgi:hypothetical protein